MEFPSESLRMHTEAQTRNMRWLYVSGRAKADWKNLRVSQYRKVTKTFYKILARPTALYSFFRGFGSR